MVVDVPSWAGWFRVAVKTTWLAHRSANAPCAQGKRDRRSRRNSCTACTSTSIANWVEEFEGGDKGPPLRSAITNPRVGLGYGVVSTVAVQRFME